jgi:hypothetical protein
MSVDTDGLRTLAGHYGSWADEVRIESTPYRSGPSFQATAAAVSETYAATGFASECLANVLRSTAAKLTAAADAYAGTDEGSATLMHETATSAFTYRAA